MTSQIVSTTIDEDFPVAGQDNDSQGFRDNFTIIKTGLATAASELTDLQNNVIIKGPIGDMAPEDVDNNFNETLIYNVRTNKVYGTVYTATTTDGLTTVDISNGEYQIFTLDRNTTLRFENWPDPAVGDVYSKIRVAFKTDGSGDYIATFTSQGGTLTPLQGAADSYNTGTDPEEVQVIEAWSTDNGENVYLTIIGEFVSAVTVSDINSIGNVTVTSPVNNQVLKYNLSTSQWVNGDPLSSIDDIPGVVLTTPTNGQVLKFDGTNWINGSDTGTIINSLSDITDVNILAPAIGQTLKFDGTLWVNSNVLSSIDDVPGVVLTTPTNGQVLKFDGTNWINGSPVSSIDDVPGVVLTTPTNGQVLKFDGTNWINDVGSINNWTGAELVVDAASVDLTKTAGYFNTGVGPADEVATLGAGVEGQIKIFAMNLDGGANMAIEVTNAAWGGAGRITFTDIGQGCTLQYFNSKWYCVGNNGATFT